MPRLVIYDAAGPTVGFLYVAADEVLVAATETRIDTEGTILVGPFEGEVVRNQLFGSFDLMTQRGEIDVFRSRVDGRRHFDVEFDDPVRLQRYQEDIDAAFAGPFEAIGNRFANRIPGGPSDDALRGGPGADRLKALGGDDLLVGGSGGDVLSGGGGGDRLIGGRGADLLFGGGGRDRMEGGPNADVFAFRSLAEAGRGSACDVARDFGGADVIDLAEIDARADRSGDQVFRFIGGADFSERAGELRYAGGRVGGDVDGDGQADFHVEIANRAELGAGDFLL